jgi:hypothetical protein
MSSQGVLRLLPLLTARSTWQHLQSLEDKERSPIERSIIIAISQTGNFELDMVNLPINLDFF